MVVACGQTPAAIEATYPLDPWQIDFEALAARRLQALSAKKVAKVDRPATTWGRQRGRPSAAGETAQSKPSVVSRHPPGARLPSSPSIASAAIVAVPRGSAFTVPATNTVAATGSIASTSWSAGRGGVRATQPIGALP